MGRVNSSSHPVITVPTLDSDLHTLELVRENKYKQVKCGLGVILSPSLNIMYTRPHVDMSSNLLVGVKRILIIRHTTLGGMKCNCEPLGKNGSYFSHRRHCQAEDCWTLLGEHVV